MAYAGPTPMIRGGTPIVAAATNLPRIGRPRRLATEWRASRTAAAPSDTCDAFPEKQGIKSCWIWIMEKLTTYRREWNRPLKMQV